MMKDQSDSVINLCGERQSNLDLCMHWIRNEPVIINVNRKRAARTAREGYGKLARALLLDGVEEKCTFIDIERM